MIVMIIMQVLNFSMENSFAIERSQSRKRNNFLTCQKKDCPIKRVNSFTRQQLISLVFI